MWAQDSVHSFLPDQVPGRWVGGGGGSPLQKGRERNGAPFFAPASSLTCVCLAA